MLRVHGLAAVPLLWALGCTSSGPAEYWMPSEEEKAAREAFISSLPEMPPELAWQLRRFEVTPEDALRRLSYTRARPRMAASLRRAILAGVVTVGMSSEHVRAAWGEPDRVRTEGGEPSEKVETWVYLFSPRTSSHESGARRILHFRNGLLVLIEQSLPEP